LGLWLILGLMLTTAIQAASQATDAQAAIVAAEEARKRAASVKSEWLQTADLIEQAKAAVDKGDFAEAVRLAEQAKEQGELGYLQGQPREFRWPGYLQ